MSNVVPIFQEEMSGGPDSLVAKVTQNVADIVGVSAQLARAVRDLSTQLDAIEKIADTLSDADAQACIKRSLTSNRDSLIRAMVALSQQIGHLPVLQKELMANICQLPPSLLPVILEPSPSSLDHIGLPRRLSCRGTSIGHSDVRPSSATSSSIA